jgi:hypothetical protein
MSDNLPTETDPNPEPLNPSADSEHQLNKIMLVGAPDWIRNVIHRLHLLGFAEAGSWSRLIPTKNHNEKMSILARRHKDRSLTS